MIEYKSLSGSVKDIDVKKRVVTGYLSAFENKDLVGDIMEKGAFSKTLNERKGDIYFLNNHEWSQPHGKFNILREDKKGLYFESNPLIDTSYSTDLMKLYEAGIVKEHSVGYQTVKSIKDRGQDARILKEVRLFEGSNVTRGANPNTPFLGVKSLTQKEINIEANILMKAIKNGTFTDETFMLLEIALKQLQQDAYNLGISLKDDEPLDDTQLNLEPKLLITEINNFRKQL